MSDICRPDWRSWVRRIRHASVGRTDDAVARSELTALADAVERGFTISRRGFLGAVLGTVAIAATVDVEALLWTPGEQSSIVLSGSDLYVVTPDWITREALKLLKNNLTFASHINRSYDRSFRGSSIGDVVRVIDRRRAA